MPKPLPPRNQCTGGFTTTNIMATTKTRHHVGYKQQQKKKKHRFYVTLQRNKHAPCVLPNGKKTTKSFCYRVYKFHFFIFQHITPGPSRTTQSVEAQAMYPTLEGWWLGKLDDDDDDGVASSHHVTRFDYLQVKFLYLSPSPMLMSFCLL